MTIPFNDWYHHTEFASWEGFPGPEETPIPPIPLSALDVGTTTLPRRLDPPVKIPKFSEMTGPQRLRLAARLDVMNALLAVFQEQGIELMSLSVGTTRVNLLARFPDHNPVPRIGLAKRHATNHARSMLRIPTLRIWSQRGLLQPIAHQTHLINTRNIIVGQTLLWAATWFAPSAFDPIPAGCVPREW